MFNGKLDDGGESEKIGEIIYSNPEKFISRSFKLKKKWRERFDDFNERLEKMGREQEELETETKMLWLDIRKAIGEPESNFFINDGKICVINDKALEKEIELRKIFN